MVSPRSSPSATASPQRRPTWFERAGCWAVGVYAFALYFAIATLVTVLNGDVLRMVESGALAALLVALGIWLARRNVAKEVARPSDPTAPPRPRSRKRKR